jgi:hypothetical protein
MNTPRAEQLRRFHGAVTAAEKRDRLGYYYSVQWNGPAEKADEPVRIVFQYRQAATGSAAREIVIKAVPGYGVRLNSKSRGQSILREDVFFPGI